MLNTLSRDCLSTRPVIHAELYGDDVAEALGITKQSRSPVLDLCRVLVAAGYDPATRLEAYRGSVLCLRVSSIGEGAMLRVSEDHSVEFKSLASAGSGLADAFKPHGR